jgi:hypothetical protein
MVVLVPAALLGQTPAAILRSQGGVWVNDYEAKDSTAIFAGDVLETKPAFSGSLTLDGSTVLLQPESVAKFQGDLLVLNHGSVSVGTSKSFKVQVNCITITPVVNEWTQYEVTDVNGTVQVAARKDDVKVELGSSGTKRSRQAETSSGVTVHEGEQAKYEESEACGVPPRATPTVTGLNPKLIAGGAAGAGVLVWLLIHGGGGKTPISTSQP